MQVHSLLFFERTLPGKKVIMILIFFPRYESVEEAAQVTIDIYLKIWAQLIKKKNLKVWIHPVLPLPQVSILSFVL